MIEYYTNLVSKNGGKLMAKWVYGMVIYTNNGFKQYSWSKDKFYFVDKPSDKINPGYPLDSISKMTANNKYIVDLSEEEKKEFNKDKEIEKVVQFIINSLKDLEK